MATVASTPLKTWVSTLDAGHAITAGNSITVTFHMTQGWEAQIPVGARYGASVSLATAVYIYPSNDGGATYDTEPLVAFSIPTTASVDKVMSVRLTTGQYVIRLNTSSPSVTLFVRTQEIITGINNI